MEVSIEEMFEVHCFTRDNYEKRGNRFPEQSYRFFSKDEVLKCLTNLVNNDFSGIYITELIIYRSADKD